MAGTEYLLLKAQCMIYYLLLVGAVLYWPIHCFVLQYILHTSYAVGYCVLRTIIIGDRSRDATTSR